MPPKSGHGSGAVALRGAAQCGTDRENARRCEKKFGAANVELDIAVQPDLLGGFILRCGDCEYDRSVKGKLDKLQQKLTGEVK